MRGYLPPVGTGTGTGTGTGPGPGTGTGTGPVPAPTGGPVLGGIYSFVPLLSFVADDGPRTVERKRRRSLAGKVVDYLLDVA